MSGSRATDRSLHHSDDVRTGHSVDAVKRSFLENLLFLHGRFPNTASLNDSYLALAQSVRDRLLRAWARGGLAHRRLGSRTVCYLSAEYLPGPHLTNNLVNLGLSEVVATAMTELGLDLQALADQEQEPGLGNGGLGRLAACLMDSLAALQVPAIGYGIRYEFGLFEQQIRDGWQVEVADRWLQHGNPWELPRPEIRYEVKLGGRTEPGVDETGRYRVHWIPARVVRGVAYDTPVTGFRVPSSNLLRLWRAEPHEEFDLDAFNHGDYYGAVHDKVESEVLTKVLYPHDEAINGKELRLQQQYFMVSCALQDMIRLHLGYGRDLSTFSDKYAVQLNDTHPALAIPELMRLLVDEHRMAWELAWEIARRTFSYTNHTLMPEALERWAVSLLGRVLPRHLELIYEINRRFLDDVRGRFPGDEARVRRVSLVDEQGERSIRMAHLACVGSRRVNGVARLHSQLLVEGLFADFHELWPDKFTNVTNGVSPRRFMVVCNPGLARLLDDVLGPAWATDLTALRRLEALADDAGFRQRWRAVKLASKRRLATMIGNDLGLAVSADSLFDVQVKRIHEYKRQHLNVLHVLTLYQRLRRTGGLGGPPRTVIFGGKAAPGYARAKLMIKLINAVAATVNGDPANHGQLRVVFFPDYGVKNGALVLAGADLSEQISTAGTEASGTGNMKLALNGALTIGTLDGANVEIRDEIGADNFFSFGLTVDEVRARKAAGYQPRALYESDAGLRDALDLIASGRLAGGDAGLFRPLLDELLDRDGWMVLADYADYVRCQDEAGRQYADQELWTRKSIVNVARMGKFSSDRTVREYCRDVWDVQPGGAGER